MKKYYVWSTILLSSTVEFTGCTGCTKKLPSPQQNLEVAAPLAIENSFSITKYTDLKLPVENNNLPTIQGHDNYYLAIKKSALEKEFLFASSKILQQGAPTSRNMQTRIVAFRRVRDQVYLLEANQGHVVTQDLPATRILAEFPILADRPNETEGELIVDFNRGMNRVFSAPGTYTSEQDGKNYSFQAPGRMNIDVILNSFIASITTKNNILEIRQIAQVLDSSKGPSARPFEFRYYISPYRPNPNFTPKETTDFRYIGFFEVAPQLEEKTGRSITLIQRWDHSKPITFFISRNTPQEYVNAIKEGILYWNEAFEREVLQVELAPAGISAPDPNYNIVQWVDDQSAINIYADTIADPRTGEIRHAQVYISSSFSIKSRKGAANLLRRLKRPSYTAARLATALTISPFSQEEALCDYDIESIGNGAFQKDLETMLAMSNNDDNSFLRASQDYIRSSIAHEIGHTLGLRHNFAGSLASTYSRIEKQKVLLDYLIDGIVPIQGQFSSSFMDYLPLSEEILLSAQVFKKKTILPYDRLAIRWAYENETFDEKTSPLYCTDGHIDSYRDCRRFDRGPMPIVSNTEEIEGMIETLPKRAIQVYLDGINADDPRDRLPVEKVNLGLKDLINDIIANILPNQFGWFSSTGPSSIIVEHNFPFIGELYKQDVLEARFVEANREVFQLGGIERTLFLTLPSEEKPDLSIAREATRNLKKLLGDKSYGFTDSESDVIIKNSNKAFNLIEYQLINTTLDLFKSTGKLSEAFPVSEIHKRLKSAAKAIIATKTTNAQGASTFRYPKDIRVKALDFLRDTANEDTMSDI